MMNKFYTKTLPVKLGVVAELNGKFWGVQYDENEGQYYGCQYYGFGPIENAMVADPMKCKRPEDLTWRKSGHIAELKEAKLRTVSEIKTYIVT